MYLAIVSGFKPALISKGLRRFTGLGLDEAMMFQTSPDFKGIKTAAARSSIACSRFQTSPDFKGIKTHPGGFAADVLGFKPALISKGLRLRRLNAMRIHASGFKPALISKGLRPPCP